MDAAIARELLRALEPMAIEAALQAEGRHMELQGERRRIVELELQQAQYEASLAERRYAACDPDNRLITAQLEKSWEATLLRVQACEVRLAALETPSSTAPIPDFAGLADDLEAAWNAPGVTMRSRQQLLRALIAEIIADYDHSLREIVLKIHWRGGQHSELRVPKPKSGEHGCRTADKAVAVIDTMATRWSDEDIAATLNRMGLPTGQGKTWTANRISSLRRVRGINAYRSAEKNGEWLTMSEAAVKLGVSHHQIRRLIKQGILAADQVVPDAPYQIRANDLLDERVTMRSHEKIVRIGRIPRIKLLCFQRFENDVHNEPPFALGRKNWLHVGSVQAGSKIAAILSIIESCRRLGGPVKPYLADMLPGLNARTLSQLTNLTPARWSAAHS